MKVFEILNSDIDYEVRSATSDKFVTTSKIGDRHIFFVAELQEGDEPHWDVLFLEKRASKQGYPKSTFEPTGSGEEFKVFSLVKKSIAEFIDRYQPQMMVFTAHKKDGNRAELYGKMLKKYLVPNGYSVKRDNLSHTEVFTVTKDKS